MFKKTLIAASLALVGATVFADGASAQRYCRMLVMTVGVRRQRLELVG